VLTRLPDPFRFPWIVERRSATDEERRAAALASSILPAAQRLETARRMSGKEVQESSVAAVVESLGARPRESGAVHRVGAGLTNPAENRALAAAAAPGLPAAGPVGR